MPRLSSVDLSTDGLRPYLSTNNLWRSLKISGLMHNWLWHSPGVWKSSNIYPISLVVDIHVGFLVRNMSTYICPIIAPPKTILKNTSFSSLESSVDVSKKSEKIYIIYQHVNIYLYNHNLLSMTHKKFTAISKFLPSMSTYIYTIITCYP